MTGLEILAGVALYNYIFSPKEGYADEKARAADEASAKETRKQAALAISAAPKVAAPFSVVTYERRLGFWAGVKYDMLKSKPEAQAAVFKARGIWICNDAVVQRLSAQGRDANGVLFSERP